MREGLVIQRLFGRVVVRLGEMHRAEDVLGHAPVEDKDAEGQGVGHGAEGGEAACSRRRGCGEGVARVW